MKCAICDREATLFYSAEAEDEKEPESLWWRCEMDKRVGSYAEAQLISEEEFAVKQIDQLLRY